MRNDDLRFGQLSAAAKEWCAGYLRAIEAHDLAGLEERLAPDCTIQFDDAPRLAGRQAVIDSLAGYWRALGAIDHDLVNVYGSATSSALEALNHFRRIENGARITLRAIAFVDRDSDGAVVSLRIFDHTGSV